MAGSRRLAATAVLVTAVAALVLAGCRHAETPGDLLIRADRLFDGERMVEPGAVIVRGREIAAVGSDLEADAQRTIDLGDATILPGFVDLHVHGLDARSEDVVAGGVTTARRPADVIAVHGDAREVRDDLADPILVLRAGRVLVDPMTR